MEVQDFLNNILSKLTSNSKVIAINLSSRSAMEIMELDKSNTITNYSVVPIHYNAFTKEFENIGELEGNLRQTFSEMGIASNSSVYLSIPTIVIDHETLPAMVAEDDDDVKTILTASVEKNYIFKKYDPAISFCKLPQTPGVDQINICYTALRSDQFLQIKTILENLGLRILVIDSGFSSLINGVITSGKVNSSIIESDTKWNIINITSNSYSIFAMTGKYLTAVYEEPLAVKSFTEEEVYQAITNSLDLIIDQYPAEQMVIVSQSDDVSAEYLASMVNVSYQKSYIEDNKNRKQIIEVGYNITQSNKSKISLEAVGIANWKLNDGFKFNYVDTPITVDTSVESILVQIGGKDVEVTPTLVKKLAIQVSAVAILILISVYVVSMAYYNGQEKEKIEIAEKISKLESELQITKQATGISMSEFLQKSYTNNTNLKKSYNAIGREIPEMLWLEEFQLAEDSRIYLSGRSYKMEDILNYYDSLKRLGKFPNLKISTLKISNNDLSDQLIKSPNDPTQETTYEFAFGQQFYVDPNVVIEAPAEDTNDAKKSLLPPSLQKANSKTNDTKNTPDNGTANNSEVPPPPTLPKQDAN